MNTHKIRIDSVSKFLKVFEKNNIQSNSERKIYFRGNADKSWRDVPSVYRNPDLIKNEHNIYHEMISKIPQEFKDCQTAFDHLVKMQHYGLPTRLLDITSDPLVALYFACNSEKNKDGKVTTFNITRNMVKTYDSDTVSILSNLVKIKDLNLIILKLFQQINNIEITDADIKKEFQILPESKTLFYRDLTSCKRILENLLEQGLKNEKDCSILFKSKELPQNRIDLYEECIKQLNMVKNILSSRSYLINVTIKFMVQHRLFPISYYEIYINEFKRLGHFIKAEKPYFDSSQIDTDHISSVLFVEPKKDNPRIIKQNGAFLIFGLDLSSDSKNKYATVSDKYYFKNTNHQKLEIIIPKKAKPGILKQLKMLSISESSLFPEADKIAAEIKYQYFSEGN